MGRESSAPRSREKLGLVLKDRKPDVCGRLRLCRLLCLASHERHLRVCHLDSEASCNKRITDGDLPSFAASQETFWQFTVDIPRSRYVSRPTSLCIANITCARISVGRISFSLCNPLSCVMRVHESRSLFGMTVDSINFFKLIPVVNCSNGDASVFPWMVNGSLEERLTGCCFSADLSLSSTSAVGGTATTCRLQVRTQTKSLCQLRGRTAKYTVLVITRFVTSSRQENFVNLCICSQKRYQFE